MAVGLGVRWEELFAARARDPGDEIAQIMALAGRTDIISFCGGIPDPVTFPGDAVAAILLEIVQAGDSAAFQYAPTRGLPGFLDFLAARLGAGVEELAVTSGGVEALELLGKVFLDAGDEVAVEAPTYLASIMSFETFGARVAGVPMDGEGLDTDALEGLLAAGLRPKLLYTIPDFQNPTGLTLGAGRRAALVELARRYGFLLVEDVAYRELFFPGEGQPPTLRSLAPDAVLQIGTFSKTFCPGVRLGWAAGPAEIVDRLVWAKQTTDQCAGALGQRLVEEYGRRGLLDEQLGRSRELYARRARATLDALERSLPPGTEWTRPRGGFFLWLTLGGGVDTSELAARAMEEGLAFVPGAAFFADGRGRDSLRLAFSRVTEEEIAEGLARLGRLVATGR